jgi:hypothetical protein
MSLNSGTKNLSSHLKNYPVDSFFSWFVSKNMDQKSGKDKKTFFQKFTDALIRLSSGSSSDNDEVELVRQSMQQHEPAAKRPRQQDT